MSRWCKCSHVVLGTVQFGVAYGRRRNEPILQPFEVRDILDAAWEIGVRSFDTADAYGVSAERLAAWLSDRGHLAASDVITKASIASSRDATAVERSCVRFSGAHSVTVLTHGATSGSDWEAFRTAAEKAGAEPGQSVYSKDEVLLAAKVGARRVQAPGNVLDLSQVDAARSGHVPLDVRSAFLQGVLLETPEAADCRAPGTGQLAAAVQTAARTVGLTPAAALLAGLMVQLINGERVIVGIDDVRQLDDVALALRSDADTVEEFLRLVREATARIEIRAGELDPRTWS